MSDFIKEGRSTDQPTAIKFSFSRQCIFLKMYVVQVQIRTRCTDVYGNGAIDAIYRSIRTSTDVPPIDHHRQSGSPWRWHEEDWSEPACDVRQLYVMYLPVLKDWIIDVTFDVPTRRRLLAKMPCHATYDIDVIDTDSTTIVGSTKIDVNRWPCRHWLYHWSLYDQVNTCMSCRCIAITHQDQKYHYLQNTEHDEKDSCAKPSSTDSKMYIFKIKR